MCVSELRKGIFPLQFSETWPLEVCSDQNYYSFCFVWVFLFFFFFFFFFFFVCFLFFFFFFFFENFVCLLYEYNSRLASGKADQVDDGVKPIVQAISTRTFASFGAAVATSSITSLMSHIVSSC